MIVFSQKHKTTKPGSETEPAEILEFRDIAKLCPVKHLKIHVEQTQVSEERQAAVHQLFQTACACRETNFARWKRCCWRVRAWTQKLQALVYDILPSTTAVFSYALGSWKLSANEQFFVGAQTEVILLQTTQIISDVCFITDHVAYTSSDKTKIIWIGTELFLLPGVDAPHHVRAWALGCFHGLISTRTFRRALTESVDSCAEIKSAPSVERVPLQWRN